MTHSLYLIAEFSPRSGVTVFNAPKGKRVLLLPAAALLVVALAADMRTTLYNERNGSSVAPSPLRTALNRPSRAGASAAPRSGAATTAERRRAATQERKAEHVRDTQSQHLEGNGDEEDGGDQSAWPSWKEQPMPKQRAAQASTRHPTQLSSFSEARAEVLRGSTRGEETETKHEKEADNLARIDRKIEASTLRPAPPEAGSGSRPPVRQPRVAQATSPGGERDVDMGRPDDAGQQPLVYAAHHGDIEAAFSLLDLTRCLTLSPSLAVSLGL